MDNYGKMKRKLRSSGAHISHLFVDMFPDTGRGLLSKKGIHSGDKIIGIPKDYLIGVKQAILDSVVSQYVLNEAKTSSFFNIHGMQILCIFLIEEIRKIKKENCETKWGFYVKTIPHKFTQPMCWDNSVIELLPKDIATLTTERQLEMKRELAMINRIIESALPDNLNEYKYICDPITWEEYRWAYCSVNSRCVFSDHDQPKHLGLTSSPSDNYFLVPFLDLLNHSSKVEVETKFNFKNNQFEVKSKTPSGNNKQVFINYGPHSDAFLLLEYGFVNVESENENNVVKVPWKTISKYFKINEEDNILLYKELQNQGLLDFAFGCFGPTYSLVVAIACFILTNQSRNSAIRNIVQSFVLPAVSSIIQSIDDYEDLKKLVNETLFHLCESLLEEVQFNIARCKKYKNEQLNIDDHLNIVIDMWKIHHHTIHTAIALMNKIDFFSDYLSNCVIKK